MANANVKVSQRQPSELPSGYCTVSDVERHLVKLIAADWDRLQYASLGRHWRSAGQLLDAVSTFLLEHLLFEQNLLPGGLSNQSLRLWFDGGMFKLDGSGIAPDASEAFAPKLTDLLYVASYSELDFSPNYTSFHSDYDEENLSELGASRASSQAFLDPKTWRVLDRPRFDISSFESFVQAVGPSFDWEYEYICRSWEKARNFAGGQIVFEGSSASKIAKKAAPELKRIAFRSKLPRNSEWRKRQAKFWLSELRGFSTEEMSSFKRADLALRTTGSSEVTKPVRNLWNAIKDIAPQEIREQMTKRGPKTRR